MTVLLVVFTVAVFAGATLVFLVQPMVAKMVLPLLGGTPSVWNTAMLFFQAVLLAGYALAHVLTRRLDRRRQVLVYLLVVAAPLVFLPLALPGWQPPDQGPYAIWLLGLLLVTAGVPYLVVTTASPLLQRWFSLTGHERAHDPYFLYAAGNGGSLLGLVAYPFVVEPFLTLPEQGWLWSGGYAVFAVAAAGCAFYLWRHASAEAPVRPAAPAKAGATSRAPAHAALGEPVPGDDPGDPGGADGAGDGPGPGPPDGPVEAVPGLVRRARWVLLAFIPSSLMLGVTTYLTTDIAAVPLLWIIPLALYLVTFILAFSGWSWVRWRGPARVLPLLVVAVALHVHGVFSLPVWAVFALHLGTLLVAGLAAHGRLAEDRPGPAHLTSFFLLVSFGGVLGGLFNAIVAPLAFDVLLEYAIVLVLALGVRPTAGRVSFLPQRWRVAEDVLVGAAALYLFFAYLDTYPDGVRLAAALGLLALFVWHLSAHALEFALVAAIVLGAVFVDIGPSLFRQRTFFGIVDVYESTDGYHVLSHGTTIHGYQYWEPEPDLRPLSYHHPDGPIGHVFRTYEDEPAMDATAVVGLGIGALAAYPEDGERMVFYEIDPVVVEVARNPEYFTYLPDAEADIDVVLGDGRLKIDEAPDGAYGLVVLDAFSSDAVPVHLLTREAVSTYVDKTGREGLVAFNISNRFVDLEPVLAGIAADLGLAGVVRHDDEDEPAGESASTWVVLARAGSDLEPLLSGDEGWRRLEAGDDAVVWTDHYSNLAGVLEWR